MTLPEQLSPRLLSWASELDMKAAAQAHTSSKLPFIDGHVALMPDAHWGMGATVGSVIPTKGAIIPAAVGVDIGCGMIAVQTDLTAEDLPETLGPLHGLLRERIPSGVGKGRDKLKASDEGAQWYLRNPNVEVKNNGWEVTAVSQLGSLGSGNHFVEVCLDADDSVWAVLHSGSRGVGNKLARRHIDTAKGLMREYFIKLEDPNLAYFVEGTDEFRDYMTDLEWAQNYAMANRETMMNELLRSLQEVVGRPFAELERINCHHNYTAKEYHRGKNLYITRKGAIRAREGDRGVIPGSMGDNSFIVTGLGNPASYHSSAHGAGRAMSRKRAKELFDEKDLAVFMEGKVWNDRTARALVDEIPTAYKNIHQVMEDQADLVTVTHELTQILNYKGT